MFFARLTESDDSCSAGSSRCRAGEEGNAFVNGRLNGASTDHIWSRSRRRCSACEQPNVKAALERELRRLVLHCSGGRTVHRFRGSASVFLRVER
jgi:hypothetical protein